MREYIKKVSNVLADFFYPDKLACWVCDKPAVVNDFCMCEYCSNNIKIYEPGLDTAPKYLDAFSAGLYYIDDIETAMQRYKYNGATYLASHFARYMHINKEWNIELIIPVPLSKRKLATRGYNQSLILAQYIGERYNIPVRDDLLIRTKNIKTLTSGNADERARMIRGIFAVTDKPADRILIVDDVCTTGSTISECAITLRRGGAKYVFGLTACYTPKVR